MVPSVLKDAKFLHFPITLVDMHATALAAKIRVLRCENEAEGGLQAVVRANRLITAPCDDCSLRHAVWCQDWAENSFLLHLREADGALRQKLRASPGTDLKLHKRADLQKRVSNFCRANVVGEASRRHLRRRLDRWTMVTLPGFRVQRAVKVMEILQRKATPRVQASYLRTICNGWCTRRRFQQQGWCRFGCGGQEDSLSHFAHCTVVTRLFVNGIHILGSHGPDAMDVFFCMNSSDEELVVARCKGLYALYRLYNGLRFHAFWPSEYQDAYNRFLREALR